MRQEGSAEVRSQGGSRSQALTGVKRRPLAGHWTMGGFISRSGAKSAKDHARPAASAGGRASGARDTSAGEGKAQATAEQASSPAQRRSSNRPPSLQPAGGSAGGGSGADPAWTPEFVSPLAAKAAEDRQLIADSPSVQNFTSQILEMQAKESHRRDHGFEQLDDVEEDEETEAETSLATLEEEFSSTMSLSSAEIRIIGSVHRWQRGNLIGSGSYGKVYMAMNSDSGEIFVVKQVPFNSANSDDAHTEEVAQLEMEIALLGTLNHPNIVKYLGTERNNVSNELSIFLEHMPGGSIAELVSRFGKLDESVIRK